MVPASFVMWDVKGAIFCCFLLHCGAKAATLLNELDDLVAPGATEKFRGDFGRRM